MTVLQYVVNVKVKLKEIKLKFEVHDKHLLYQILQHLYQIHIMIQIVYHHYYKQMHLYYHQILLLVLNQQYHRQRHVIHLYLQQLRKQQILLLLDYLHHQQLVHIQQVVYFLLQMVQVNLEMFFLDKIF